MTGRRIDPARPLGVEARHLLAGHLDDVASALAVARTRRDDGLHQARRNIKKARALLRLLRDADRDFHAGANAKLRDLSRSLSAARDVAAMIEAVDRLSAARAEENALLLELRAHLEERRAASAVDEPALRDAIEDGMNVIAALRRETDGWRVPDEPKAAARALATRARSSFARARDALVRAEALRRDDDFHDLRKAVKAYWAQVGLLRRLWPRQEKPRRGRLNELGEKLGAHNDLAMLAGLVRRRETGLGKARRKALADLVADEKKRSRREALKAARQLFAERPRKLRSTFRRHLEAQGAVGAAPLVRASAADR